jgi:ATPase subunit of ABC transporter with duplicated ATPase domains
MRDASANAASLNLGSSSTVIDIRGVSIKAGSAQLLDGSRVCLNRGRRYGLIGPNGSGKSTLFTILQGKWLLPVDARPGLSVVTVGQEAGQLTNLIGDRPARAEWSPLAVVLERVRASQVRTTVVDGTTGSIVTSVEAEVMADAVATEEEASGVHRWPATTTLPAGSVMARADAMLRGFGLTRAQRRSNPVRELSGGFRMRVELAAALLCDYDLLLLDEPTNFLDMPSAWWLRHLLQHEVPEDKTVVLVTHDRDFLDSVCTDILSLASHKLKHAPGNFAAYVEAREQRGRQADHKSAVEARQRADLQSQIEHLQAMQRKGKNRVDLGGSIRSKKKQLEKVGVVTSWGDLSMSMTRFKTLAWAYGADGFSDDFVDREALAALSLSFQPPPPLGVHFDSGDQALLQLDRVSFRYPDSEVTLFDNLTLSIAHGERVVIVGANGTGKSTAMRVLAGELEPVRGSRSVGTGAAVRLFSQDAAACLKTDAASGSLTPLAYAMQCNPGSNEQAMRRRLALCGLTGNRVLVPLSKLSGGQRVRVALAMLGAANVLLLDEPSSHLDIESVTSLSCAIEDYAGAVVVVSHDVWFLREIIASATSRVRVLVASGTSIEELGSDLDSYLEQLEDKCEKIAEKLVTV